MIIGCPKEIKNHEYRAGLIPSSVSELVKRGHQVVVETHLGAGIGFDDKAYQEAGAIVVKTAQEVFDKATLIIKVKEPQLTECAMLKEHHILFTFLHLAADHEQAKGLSKSGCTAISYETVTDDLGGLPILAPMSEVAGRMSIQKGAHILERIQGGRGILLGGIPGVQAANVIIIGGGVVGCNAARMAMGLGANVTILDRNIRRLNELDLQFGPQLHTLYSNYDNLCHVLKTADLVVGAVLVAGAEAPKLVSRDMLKLMPKHSAMVDVAIDQGGCFETSRPTTHQDPIYEVDGIIHYCVTNIPGAVPRTSAIGLNNVTLPYIISLAEKGSHVLLENSHFMHGLNVKDGYITHAAVAESLNMPYRDPITLLSA